MVMVISVISHYWKMAGFESEAEDMKLNDGTKHKLVRSIVKTYQSLQKSKSKTVTKLRQIESRSVLTWAPV